MTKILNFALKIKGGGREGGTCEVLRPCHPPKIWNVHLRETQGINHAAIRRKEEGFIYFIKGTFKIMTTLIRIHSSSFNLSIEQIERVNETFANSQVSCSIQILSSSDITVTRKLLEIDNLTIIR